MYPEDTTKERKEGFIKDCSGEVLDRSFSLSHCRVSGRPTLSQEAKGRHSISSDAWYMLIPFKSGAGLYNLFKVILVHCWWIKAAGICPTFEIYGKCETFGRM